MILTSNEKMEGCHRETKFHKNQTSKYVVVHLELVAA